MESSEGIQLTRYLYVKDEVILALILSIIQKHESSYFWAFELYYSGFKKELNNTFWLIYYDFFNSLNPSFENYLLNKLKNGFNDEDDNNDVKIIGNIIENFNIRTHNMDVFILRQISKQFEFDVDFINDYIQTKDYNIFKTHFIQLHNNKDYLMIGFLIVNILHDNHFNKLLETLCELFLMNREKILLDFEKISKRVSSIIQPRILLLSKIIQVITKSHNKFNQKKKNIYITIDSNDIIHYKTVISSMCNNINDRSLPPYKILSKVCLYKIDTFNCLSLFHLKRENNMKYTLFDNWLYYASFSPLWKKRIDKYRGIVDHETRQILFIDDDLEEDFFNKYNMELDEQTKIIQDSILSTICKNQSFLNLYLNHNNNSIINIDNDILDEMDKIQI